jgi:hypothetical protein
MTPQEVLLEAADLIEKHGWWNGGPIENIKSNNNVNCPVTAILAVCRDSNVVLKANDLLALALPLTTEIRTVRRISKWNDSQPNGETVIAKLREVARS